LAKIIHLETSTKVCSVALSEKGKLVDSITEKADTFSHSERLHLIIDTLVKKNELTFKDLDAISVSSGPGSYTGLRIGVSSAKGLCYALDIPLISIDSLKCLFHYANNQLKIHDQSLTVCMIDARRMEAFTAIYDFRGYEIKPISAEIFDENYLVEVNPNIPIYLVGDAQHKCKEIWKNREHFVFTELEADAIGQIAPAYEKFCNGDFEDLAYFEPFYLKDFQTGVKAI
jgi:tRNA threonylcarbamoyladenosine biosynthesis protein TsaB